MKSTLALLFVVLPAFAVAQDNPMTPATAAAPGCGTFDVKFEVKTDRSQHPVVKPGPGKALVYFLQDDAYFQSIPRPTTRFGLDGNWVGATQSNAYFYVSVNPGEHHLCAGWQSFVGFSSGQGIAAAHFTAGAGNTYYFLVRDHSDRERGPAGMEFAPVDSDEALLLMSRFGFSTSHPKK